MFLFRRSVTGLFLLVRCSISCRRANISLIRRSGSTKPSITSLPMYPLLSLNTKLEPQFSVRYTSLCFSNFGKLMLLCVKKIGRFTAGSPTIPAALLWVPGLFPDSWWTNFFVNRWWRHIQWHSKWLSSCKLKFFDRICTALSIFYLWNAVSFS